MRCLLPFRRVMTWPRVEPGLTSTCHTVSEKWREKSCLGRYLMPAHGDVHIDYGYAELSQVPCMHLQRYELYYGHMHRLEERMH